MGQLSISLVQRESEYFSHSLATILSRSLNDIFASHYVSQQLTIYTMRQ